jgi:hypothetical protein
MRKFITIVTAAAVISQIATPVLAADMFNPTTMLGWRRTADATAMAYVRLPLRAVKVDSRQPRVGLMIGAPGPYSIGRPINRAASPSMVDFGFSGRDFRSNWAASLTVNDAVAWTSDPQSLPKNTRNLFDGGITWVVVGVLSVGLMVGGYALADKDK